MTTVRKIRLLDKTHLILGESLSLLNVSQTAGFFLFLQQLANPSLTNPTATKKFGMLLLIKSSRFLVRLNKVAFFFNPPLSRKQRRPKDPPFSVHACRRVMFKVRGHVAESLSLATDADVDIRSERAWHAAILLFCSHDRTRGRVE